MAILCRKVESRGVRDQVWYYTTLVLRMIVVKFSWRRNKEDKRPGSLEKTLGPQVFPRDLLNRGF